MESLDDVFAALHPLLARHADSLNVVKDEPGDLQVQTRKLGPSGTAMSFGAVKLRAESVRFQLMPVHSHPAVIADLSAALRERMRGGGSFDFEPQTLTPELVEELSALVDGGLAVYRADKLA
ncbi:MAG TPA: hypothetical protein VGV90_14325 [Solirubrobacteraceae bacterium]|nr:hypothetical protein [Solirubrobacteraceae bacterium]